jgi:uncharacterized protein
MTKQLIVIPRWSGNSQSDWYPWLKHELAAKHPGAFDPVVVADMPHPELPIVDVWVKRVQELLGPDRQAAAQTVVAGHSVGCQAVMRALAAEPSDWRVAGLFFVAGWFRTDEPWDSLMPWIETPLDTERVRAAAGKTVVVISNNDHHTHDWRGNRQLWEQRFDAQVVVVPGADHFNGQRYPEVLQALVDNFGPNGAGK